MAIAGLGSVSNHCVNNLHCPVICIKQSSPSGESSGTHLAGGFEPSAKICIAVDNTEHSHRMIQWAAHTFVKPHTKVYVVSVCHTSLDHTRHHDGAVALLDPSPPVPPAEDAFQPEVHDILCREAQRAISAAVEILCANGVRELCPF